MNESLRLGSFLTGTTLSEYITGSARRALRGQTPACLRSYSFSFDENLRSVLLRAEVDTEPTEAEWDDLNTVEAEISADFSDLAEIETFIEVVPLGRPTRPLDGGVAFERDNPSVSHAAE